MGRVGAVSRTHAHVRGGRVMIREDSILQVDLRIPYTFTTGEVVGTFLGYLKDGQLMGVECEKCQTRFFPPLDLCEQCGASRWRWVKVPDVWEIVLVVPLPRKAHDLVFVKTGGFYGSALLLADKGLEKGVRVRLSLKEAPEGRITDIIARRL